MSLSYLTPYNDMLQKTIHEMKPSPADVANYPEILPMMGGRKLRDSVVPESLPYASPLGLVKEAERELRSNPLHGGEMSGGEMSGGMYGGNIFTDAGKSISKTAKKAVSATKKDIADVKRVATKIAKSKEAKAVGKFSKSAAKKTATLGLDIAEKAAPALGGLAGAAAAVAMMNPELAPAAGAIGAAAADQLAKRGRKAVKAKTGLGVLKEMKMEVKEKIKRKVDKIKEKGEKKEGSGRAPSAWILHIKQYAKDNDVSYKQAMKDARASYKK